MPLVSDYSLVPLTSRDLSELQQLYDSCSDYMFLVTGAGPDPDAAARLLEALPPGVSAERKLVLGLRAQNHQLLGAVDVITGFPQEETWYIGEFIIAPHARALGLGRALYGEVRDRAESVDAASIDLAVHEGNAVAFAFWSRMGFEETGRTRYRVKSLESPFVLMSAALSASRA